MARDEWKENSGPIESGLANKACLLSGLKYELGKKISKESIRVSNYREAQLKESSQKDQPLSPCITLCCFVSIHTVSSELAYTNCFVQQAIHETVCRLIC